MQDQQLVTSGTKPGVPPNPRVGCPASAAVPPVPAETDLFGPEESPQRDWGSNLTLDVHVLQRPPSACPPVTTLTGPSSRATITGLPKPPHSLPGCPQVQRLLWDVLPSGPRFLSWFLECPLPAAWSVGQTLVSFIPLDC